jgi:hypothetical protein
LVKGATAFAFSKPTYCVSGWRALDLNGHLAIQLYPYPAKHRNQGNFGPPFLTTRFCKEEIADRTAGRKRRLSGRLINAFGERDGSVFVPRLGYAWNSDIESAQNQERYTRKKGRKDEGMVGPVCEKGW